MKSSSIVFLLFLALVLSACQKKQEETQAATPTEAEIKAADEASLLATAKNAGVSEADALAAKAEIDKVYDETAAKMDKAEAERNARFDKSNKDNCVANCPDD